MGREPRDGKGEGGERKEIKELRYVMYRYQLSTKPVIIMYYKHIQKEKKRHITLIRIL